uniref:Cyclin-T1-3 n=1 Tax=Anthurium amnicola TaxID=1678845 RepID=A0A1D1YRN8_9ARAE
MVGRLPENASQIGVVSNQAYDGSDDLIYVPQRRSKWYFSKEEIETHSPSRKDGIDLMKENQLRMQYCSFLQNLGIKLVMPQVTIATAMMFCHRFYLYHSHAKNDWQSIATVCLFLASKVEETPCSLSKVIPAAYEMIYRNDPAAVKRIQLKDVYEKQKGLIVLGERLVLSTLGFDLDIQHPYKPLVAAVKKLGFFQNDVVKVAWNFVNDWLRTTLCMQYKPHYIAAGSIYLAAKLNKVKLPSENGQVWWHEFDITPRQFEEVIQEMMELFGYMRRATVPCTNKKESPTPLEVQKLLPPSPESCVLSRPGSSSSTGHDLCGEAGGDEAIPHVNDKHSVSLIQTEENASMNENKILGSHTQVSESPNGVLDQETASTVGNKQVCRGSGQNMSTTGLVSNGTNKIDKERIKAALKRRRQDGERTEVSVSDDLSEDAWIERELESGLEIVHEPTRKKPFL